MQNPFKDIDKEKIIEEHSSIICNYNKTGFLDRENAIEKYIAFNKKYYEYYSKKEVIITATNTSIKINDATNDVIIDNLKSQLLWLTGSDYLKRLGI